MTKLLRFFALASLMILFLVSTSGWHIPSPSNIRIVSAHLKVRKLSHGKKLEYDADMCYSANGDMVAHYHAPLDYYILNNKKGQIRIYQPKDNTLRTVTDAFMGSSSSYFYAFVNFRSSDLNLRDMGFILRNTKYEEGLQISDWLPPAAAAARLSKVELVHRNGKIIYAGYFDGKEQLFKKVYYGKSENIKGVEFPTTLTEITYMNPSRTDSTIEKSNYSAFKVNEQVNDPVCSFQIPPQAKTAD